MDHDPRAVPQDRLRAAIAAERIALADILTGLTDEQWRTPSLCAGWTVHEVLAHISQSGHPHTWAWIGAALRHGGPDGGEDVRTRARAARHSPAELLAQLRDSATSTYRLPLSNRWDPYVDLLVHGQDALRPLGVAHPPPRELLAPALTFAWRSPLYGVRRRLRTVRFTATDLDWTAGDGPLEVRGPSADLLLAVTGRSAGLAGLTGSGHPAVAAELSHLRTLGGDPDGTDEPPVKTRVAPVLGVLLVLALLASGAAWFAASRGLTAADVRELVDPPPPEPCSEDDPTTSGCLTPTALRLHDAVVDRFGEPGPDAPIRSITCWSEHAWNPSSDHPAGRSCDLFPDVYGEFPADRDLDDGWAVADWVRENASELRVRYVIWQGRIWYRGTGDSGEGRENWGRPYDGGGVYDADDATGGHYDHVHVSVRR